MNATPIKVPVGIILSEQTNFEVQTEVKALRRVWNCLRWEVMRLPFSWFCGPRRWSVKPQKLPWYRAGVATAQAKTGSRTAVAVMNLYRAGGTRSHTTSPAGSSSWNPWRASQQSKTEAKCKEVMEGYVQRGSLTDYRGS